LVSALATGFKATAIGAAAHATNDFHCDWRVPSHRSAYHSNRQ
jgi:hypothetical protein